MESIRSFFHGTPEEQQRAVAVASDVLDDEFKKKLKEVIDKIDKSGKSWKQSLFESLMNLIAAWIRQGSKGSWTNNGTINNTIKSPEGFFDLLRSLGLDPESWYRKWQDYRNGKEADEQLKKVDEELEKIQYIFEQVHLLFPMDLKIDEILRILRGLRFDNSFVENNSFPPNPKTKVKIPILNDNTSAVVDALTDYQMDNNNKFKYDQMLYSVKLMQIQKSIDEIKQKGDHAENLSNLELHNLINEIKQTKAQIESIATEFNQLQDREHQLQNDQVTNNAAQTEQLNKIQEKQSEIIQKLNENTNTDNTTPVVNALNAKFDEKSVEWLNKMEQHLNQWDDKIQRFSRYAELTYQKDIQNMNELKDTVKSKVESSLGTITLSSQQTLQDINTKLNAFNLSNETLKNIQTQVEEIPGTINRGINSFYDSLRRIRELTRSVRTDASGYFTDIHNEIYELGKKDFLDQATRDKLQSLDDTMKEYKKNVDDDTKKTMDSLIDKYNELITLFKNKKVELDEPSAKLIQSLQNKVQEDINIKNDTKVNEKLDSIQSIVSNLQNSRSLDTETKDMLHSIENSVKNYKVKVDEDYQTNLNSIITQLNSIDAQKISDAITSNVSNNLKVSTNDLVKTTMDSIIDKYNGLVKLFNDKDVHFDEATAKVVEALQNAVKNVNDSKDQDAVNNKLDNIITLVSSLKNSNSMDDELKKELQSIKEACSNYQIVLNNAYEEHFNKTVQGLQESLDDAELLFSYANDTEKAITTLLPELQNSIKSDIEAAIISANELGTQKYKEVLDDQKAGLERAQRLLNIEIKSVSEAFNAGELSKETAEKVAILLKNLTAVNSNGDSESPETKKVFDKIKQIEDMTVVMKNLNNDVATIKQWTLKQYINDKPENIAQYIISNLKSKIKLDEKDKAVLTDVLNVCNDVKSLDKEFVADKIMEEVIAKKKYTITMTKEQKDEIKNIITGNLKNIEATMSQDQVETIKSSLDTIVKDAQSQLEIINAYKDKQLLEEQAKADISDLTENTAKQLTESLNSFSPQLLKQLKDQYSNDLGNFNLQLSKHLETEYAKAETIITNLQVLLSKLEHQSLSNNNTKPLQTQIEGLKKEQEAIKKELLPEKIQNLVNQTIENQPKEDVSGIVKNAVKNKVEKKEVQKMLNDAFSKNLTEADVTKIVNDALNEKLASQRSDKEIQQMINTEIEKKLKLNPNQNINDLIDDVVAESMEKYGLSENFNYPEEPTETETRNTYRPDSPLDKSDEEEAWWEEYHREVGEETRRLQRAEWIKAWNDRWAEILGPPKEYVKTIASHIFGSVLRLGIKATKFVGLPTLVGYLLNNFILKGKALPDLNSLLPHFPGISISGSALTTIVGGAVSYALYKYARNRIAAHVRNVRKVAEETGDSELEEEADKVEQQVNRNNIRDLENQISKLQHENVMAENELHETQKTLKRYKEINTDNEKQLDYFRKSEWRNMQNEKELHNQRKKREEENATYRSKVGDLNSRFDQLTKNVDSLNKKIVHGEEKEKKLKAKIAIQKSTLKANEEEKKEYETRLQRAKAETEHVRMQEAATHAQLKLVQHQLEQEQKSKEKENSNKNKKSDSNHNNNNNRRDPPGGHSGRYGFNSSGYGATISDDYALSDYDITRIVDTTFNNYHGGWGGVWCYDEINKIPVKRKEKWGFILNTLMRNDPEDKVGHWVAVFIDNVNKHICYYDSFGENPKFLPVFKSVLPRFKGHPEYGYEFKINKIKNQRITSANCGFFAMSFLDKMINKNYTFKEATDFNSIEGERRMNLLKSKFNFI